MPISPIVLSVTTLFLFLNNLILTPFKFSPIEPIFLFFEFVLSRLATPISDMP